MKRTRITQTRTQWGLPMWCDGCRWCGVVCFWLIIMIRKIYKSENRRCCRCYRPMFNWYVYVYCILMLSNWVLKHLHIFASGVCFHNFHLANKFIYVREPKPKFYNKPFSFTLSLLSFCTFIRSECGVVQLKSIYIVAYDMDFGRQWFVRASSCSAREIYGNWSLEAHFN